MNYYNESGDTIIDKFLDTISKNNFRIILSSAILCMLLTPILRWILTLIVTFLFGVFS